MSKFWQKKYISKYTGAEIDAAVAKAGDATKVTANPTLAGTEAALTGLEVGDTKYKVEQPINVVANPTLAGTESALEGLQVGDIKYKVEGGGIEDYVINGTFSGAYTTPTATLDKTYDQIKAAYDAGKHLVFKIDYDSGFGFNISIYSYNFTYSPGLGSLVKPKFSTAVLLDDGNNPAYANVGIDNTDTVSAVFIVCAVQT